MKNKQTNKQNKTKQNKTIQFTRTKRHTMNFPKAFGDLENVSNGILQVLNVTTAFNIVFFNVMLMLFSIATGRN